eukprot:15449504-Alexandrium_andersonii.AAC.1
MRSPRKGFSFSPRVMRFSSLFALTPNLATRGAVLEVPRGCRRGFPVGAHGEHPTGLQVESIE